jgi:hypothetical protein
MDDTAARVRWKVFRETVGPVSIHVNPPTTTVATYPKISPHTQFQAPSSPFACNAELLEKQTLFPQT